jgi:hypothetical protein
VPQRIAQEVPSAGASLFAYFFGVAKSKASGGTRPAGFKRFAFSTNNIPNN